MKGSVEHELPAAGWYCMLLVWSTGLWLYCAIHQTTNANNPQWQEKAYGARLYTGRINDGELNAVMPSSFDGDEQSSG